LVTANLLVTSPKGHWSEGFMAAIGTSIWRQSVDRPAIEDRLPPTSHLENVGWRYLHSASSYPLRV